MHVLITGGGGFIGSHLVDHLLSTTDATITVLDDFSTGTRANLEHVSSDRVDIQHGDVRTTAPIRDAVADADSIYHLAAAVGVEKIVENPLDSLRTNLTGTENVLEAAREHAIPVFVASSSEVYGKNTAVPFSETDDRILGPTTSARWSYAAAKATDEFMALSYHETHDLPVVVGRFFNIVGPRQTGQYGMVIPTFVEQALSDDPLTVYGDGEQTRSFTHVHDAVEIIYELMHTDEATGEVFNIGAPDPTSITELAERIIDLTDSDSEITHIPLEEAFGPEFEDPDHREPDVSKLESTISWSPETDLDRILRDVIAERSEMELTADD